MKANPDLVPLLIVQGARGAIDFYRRALGATLLACYEHGPERRVSHADLVVQDAPFSVTEEARAWNSDAPPSLGGSPVVMQLRVADADASVASMLDAGATKVFPARELFGERMARVRDPFGHLWILREPLHALSQDEIQRQRDQLFARAVQQAPSPTPSARGKEEIRLSAPPAAAQALTGEASPGAASAQKRRRIHLVLGPVGAGKSTFATRLARDTAGVHVALDDWMATLFSPDRPDDGVVDWYVQRAARCLDQIWKLADGILSAGVNAILELGLLTKAERENFYRRVDGAGRDLTIHVLDAARDVRRRRVTERNESRGATFSMLVPPAVFELASDLWEPPAPAELAGRDARFIRTD